MFLCEVGYSIPNVMYGHPIKCRDSLMPQDFTHTHTPIFTIVIIPVLSSPRDTNNLA